MNLLFFSGRQPPPPSEFDLEKHNQKSPKDTDIYGNLRKLPGAREAIDPSQRAPPGFGRTFCAEMMG